MTVRKTLPGLALPAALGLAVLVTAVAAIMLTRETHRIAAIWPVNALVLTVLINIPRREWRWALVAAWLGNLAANMISGDSALMAMLLAGANIVEVTVVAMVAGRRGAIRMMRRSGLLRFALAVLCGCLVSTALVTAIFATLANDLTLQATGLWFAADILGLLVFTPILSALSKPKLTSHLSENWRPTAVALILLATVSIAVFYQTQFPLLFVPGALLAIVAVNSGFVGAAVGVLIVSVIAITATALGHGPVTLVKADLPVQILLMQMFLVTLTLISLTVGATVADRSILVNRLKASRRIQQKRAAKERLLVEQARLAERLSKVGYWHWNLETQDFFQSPEITRINGNQGRVYGPGEAGRDILARLANNYCDEDRARVLEIMREGFKSVKGWEYDATLIRGNDGSRRGVSSMAACLTDDNGTPTGFFGVLKDLTDERAVLRNLAEKEKQYRLLADNSGDVIATYTAEGVFTYLSPSIEDMLGYRPDELIGRNALEIIVKEDRAATAETFARAALSTERVSVEYRARRKDGNLRWVEARPSFQRDESGTVVEIIDTVRDVTDRKAYETELAAARRVAESAAAAKADFLSSMSHEIRTPLNGVLGYAEVLARTPLSEDQLTYVDRIRSAGVGLNALVNDILDSAKIEAGKMTVESAPFDLVALINEVTDLTKIAARNDLSFSTRFPADLDGNSLGILGDEQRTRQVLLNLLGNAVKFTSKGGIRVETEISDDTVVVRVIDTGIGISSSAMSKLFTEFSQADSSVSQQFGGTGLGLSISRSLARLMGGDIRLESEQGVGTTALFSLPYKPAKRRAAAPVAQPAGPATRSLRVLVVDDVEANLDLVSILLSQEGHQPAVAGSAAEAMDILQSGEEFDLVLMDVQMPVTDGMEATRAIRRLGGAFTRLFIVALTANVLPEQVAQCRKAGMDDHLAKPIRPDALNALLARVSKATREAEAGSRPAPDLTAAVRAVADRYRQHMLKFPDELAAISARPPAEQAQALATFAHSVAGTAGSLGFEAVSQAAFRLEEAAREQVGGTADPQGLDEHVAALLAAVSEPVDLE